MTISMAEFRARYPKALLPSFFDGIEVLGTPSAFVARETRVWVTAIFWAMGDRSMTLLDLFDAEEAERLVLEFGPPVDPWDLEPRVFATPEAYLEHYPDAQWVHDLYGGDYWAWRAAHPRVGA